MKTLMTKLETLGFTKETGLDGLSLNNVAVSLHWSGEKAVVAVDDKQVFVSESEEEIIAFVKSQLPQEETKSEDVEAKYNDYEMLDVRKELVSELRNKANRLEKSFEQHEYTEDEIKQSIDDLITQFMRDKWGVDFESNSQAQAFYENTATEMRTDLQYEMIDLYKSMS